MTSRFVLKTPFEPAGDQVQAIDRLVEGVDGGVARSQAVPAFCPESPEVDPRELSDNYLDWLAEHPERLEEPAIEGMVAMLALRYPCRR